MLEGLKFIHTKTVLNRKVRKVEVSTGAWVANLRHTCRDWEEKLMESNSCLIAFLDKGQLYITLSKSLDKQC